MHANELLESRNKIIKAFKDDFFLTEHLKKSDDAAYDFMLKNVNFFKVLILKKFIQEIRSMDEKINLSLFEDFFQSSSPAEYAKELINTKNADENKKKNVEEIKNRISDLEDSIKKNEWQRKKKCKGDIRDY